MEILILGSKEYPLGSSNSYDVITSGGIERYVENLIEEFTRYSDVQIAVITRKFPSVPFFQIIKNIKIYRVNWLRGFFFRNPTFNLNAFLISLSLKYDVILCVGVFSSLFGVILSYLKRVPLIHHFAGMHHDEPQYNYFIKKTLYMLENIAYRFLGDMVFLSEENKTNFKYHMGFLPERNHIIPTGVDVKHFSPSSIHNVIPPLRLITVGRLIKVKGIQEFIRALAKLRNEIPFLASIVGDGPCRKTLEGMLEGYSLKERVAFEGNVLPDRVVEFLREAHIYVLPSYSEGLPQSLLEAMACGLPCIVTDIGLPIKHGETGIVVPPSDADAIAQAILGLAACPSLMETLGKNARNYILSTHSREKWAASIYEISKTLALRKGHYRKLTSHPKRVNAKF